MISMKARVKQDRVRIGSVMIDAPEGEDNRMDWYAVTLRMGRGSVTTKVGHGKAVCADPTAEDVLSMLASAAVDVENADSFEDWCAEFGRNTDSRKAYEQWEEAQEAAAEFRRFLGDKYDAYLWHTERV
jgi:hypothetical protein